jgi:hypothetical protein
MSLTLREMRIDQVTDNQARDVFYCKERKNPRNAKPSH